MRIGELSSRTGVPVPTIKYYLREGLLPAGELTSPNQAQYGEAHARRLRLVRAMLEVGRLSIAAAREVLAAFDAPGTPMHTALGIAQVAVTSPVTAQNDEEWRRAERLVGELTARRGWQVKPDNPARQSLVQLVLTFRELGQDDLLELLDEYAAAADRLAAAELATVAARAQPDDQVEGAVLGIVLGDAALAALRRLAQEEASRRAFPARAE